MVDLLFYLMAAGAVLTAIGVVVARSPVLSVIWLLGSFACLAVIYLLAGFQFLAAIQILVYGGAVMVLFLFTVMLLNLGELDVARSRAEPLFHLTHRAVTGLAVAVALGAAGLIGILRGARHLVPPEGGYVVPEAGLDPLGPLAAAMFTRYSLPFEAASVLLLVTAVGVLVLAKRNRPDLPGAGTGARATTSTLAAPPARAAEPRPEREEVLS